MDVLMTGLAERRDILGRFGAECPVVAMVELDNARPGTGCTGQGTA